MLTAKVVNNLTVEVARRLLCVREMRVDTKIQLNEKSAQRDANTARRKSPPPETPSWGRMTAKI